MVAKAGGFMRLRIEEGSVIDSWKVEKIDVDSNTWRPVFDVPLDCNAANPETDGYTNKDHATDVVRWTRAGQMGQHLCLVAGSIK